MPYTKHYFLSVLFLFVPFVSTLANAEDGFKYVYGREPKVFKFQKSLPKVKAGSSYIDPTFHTRVTRITNVLSKRNPSGCSAGITNEYARFDPESAKGKWLLLRCINAQWYLYDAKKLTFVRKLPMAGDIEPRWHGTDPDIFFYVSGPRFYRYNAAKKRSTLIYDFTRDYPSARVAHSRYEGDGLLDSRYWAFMIKTGGGATLDWVTFDAGKRRIVASYKNKTGRTPGATGDISMSMTGRYVLVHGDLNNGSPSYVCNRNWSNCRELRGGTYGHGDLALSADGRDLFVAQNTRTDYIEAVYLDTLKVVRVQSLAGLFRVPGAYWGLHISGNISAQGKRGWALVSTYGSGAEAKYWSDGALYLLELKPNGRAWMLAHTNARTSPGTGKDYWAEAFAAINNEGTKVFWASNWRITGRDYVDVYQVSLPKYP